MSQRKFKPDARRLITESCLIAADIDKTLLAQDEKEKYKFWLSVAPRLLEAAALGTQLAFLTGNSMDELTRRFLKWLVDYLNVGDLRARTLCASTWRVNCGLLYGYKSYEC